MSNNENVKKKAGMNMSLKITTIGYFIYLPFFN